MNASDQTGKLRRSSPGNGSMHSMSPASVIQQRKPVWQVLETTAIDRDGTATPSPDLEQKDALQLPITSTPATPERFDFSSPISDEDLHNLTTKVPCGAFDGLQNSEVHGTKVTLLPPPQPPRKSRESNVQRSSALSQFTYQSVYQNVESRTFVGYRPSPESAPEKFLYWVKEKLSCGHSLAVYPVPGEKFNARKRSCHECLKELIHSVEGRKPVQKVLQAKRKQTGNSIWPLVFIAVLLAILAATLYARRPKIELYACQWCQPSSVVHVLAQYGDYQYLLQRVVDGKAEDAQVRNICTTQKPLFRTGYTLKKLAFIDRGDCWDTEPINPAWLVVRNAEGSPILPSNCTQQPSDKSPWRVSCNGIPKF